VRFFLLLFLLMPVAQASDEETIAPPFVCSVLLTLQAHDSKSSRFIYEFIPEHDVDNPPDAIFGALEWVTEHAFAGSAGRVVIKTGTQKEMAAFFLSMAELTDQKVYESLLLKRAGARDKFDRGGARPVPSPAREMQVATQSGDLKNLQPDFVVVQLNRRAASWESRLVPQGTVVPREMGILLTQDGEKVRAAFLMIDPSH
jgi:hypothetical protein